MKTLITLLLVGLLALPALGQRGGSGGATDFQGNYIKKDSVTLDSTSLDTIIVQLPRNRGKALFMGYIMLDDLGPASGGVAEGDVTHDSFQVRYKPHLGPSIADTLSNSSLAGIALTDAQIYNGPSGSLVDFDDAVTWADSLNYGLIFDMDGYPWRYLWILLSQTANDCLNADAATNDCTRVYFWLDVD